MELLLVLGFVFLVLVPALVLMVYMATTISAFSFHAIPDYARQGNRAARWYLRIVLGGFSVAVVAFLWILSRR